jgi:hypothetical protein
MQTRKKWDAVSKEFLIGLLTPFHPTLTKGEEITNLEIQEVLGTTDMFNLKYTIVKGGVENKELSERN